ncbi:hypothetical protein [Paenibacillus qinlingensis]|uniref:hypothetical protein n=1 Tax=Paenibacillus qinlingensis TaxID=1837343 RepID=UPI001564EBB7|nr:hypothetical protein [Paenibacillus qinlingensis]NQX60573.1 hypothetical protein [Paenibacillus qinlingensis]
MTYMLFPFLGLWIVLFALNWKSLKKAHPVNLYLAMALFGLSSAIHCYLMYARQLFHPVVWLEQWLRPMNPMFFK